MRQYRRIRYRGRRTGPARPSLFPKWLVLLAVFFAFLISFDRLLRPMAETQARHQAVRMATDAINDAVIQELGALELGYDDLIALHRGEGGEILALETNAVRLNLLKANVTKAVSARLEGLSGQETALPLGTLVGGYLFSGRGPGVPFRVACTGSAASSFSDRFDTAGINQTRHQILLEIKVELAAYLPGMRISVPVQTSFIVAETVMIGDVPSYYGAGAGVLPQLP